MVHDTGEGFVCLKCQNSAEILFIKIIVLLVLLWWESPPLCGLHASPEVTGTKKLNTQKLQHSALISYKVVTLWPS